MTLKLSLDLGMGVYLDSFKLLVVSKTFQYPWKTSFFFLIVNSDRTSFENSFSAVGGVGYSTGGN